MVKCSIDSCRDHRIFESEFCWYHTEDKDFYRERLSKVARNGTSLHGANLSKANLSNLDLTRCDLSGANLSRASLANSILYDANLKGAELLGADLTNSDLTSADLGDADMTRCCLAGARFWHANLEGANLIEANLDRADLWNARLFNIRLWRTNLAGAVSLGKKNFRSRLNKLTDIFRINEKGIQSSEEAYRTLKSYFISNGRYNDASWASFKEKSMEKLLLKKKRNIAYLPSLIMGLSCGYGEKPYRVVLSSALLILIYAFIYYVLGAVTFNPSPAYSMSPGDHIYFSIVTFTTLGYGDFIPRSSILARSLAASEAFIGAFLMGLFIFTLARKYSAR